MSFWARVTPDKMGRPTTIRSSSRVAKAIGGEAFTLELEKDVLILEVNPLEGEYKLTTTNSFGAGRLLDQCNKIKLLEPRPFVVRKDGRIFLFELWKYDDQLPATSSRLASAPMKFMPVRKLHNAVFSMEKFIKLFALAFLVAPFTESDINFPPDERVGEVLPALPAMDSIKARFGGWSRFNRFLEYKTAQFKEQGLTEDELKSAIAEILEEANG